METITFHCKVISPLFLGGAYSDQAELRPPSIKGALRFWARAIAKHWIWEEGKEDHQRLLKFDEEIFGGVKMYQKKSLVSVEVRHGQLDTLDTIKGEGLNQFGEGLKYLLYSLAVHNGDKKGIKTEFPFDVTLRSKDQVALNKVIAAFWVLTYCGALGTRARRGAGAFEVTNITGNNLPNGISFKPDGNIIFFLKNGVQAVSKLYAVPRDVKTPNGYSTLGENIWVSKNGRRTWEEALEDIGEVIRQHRMAIPNRDRSKRKFTMDTLDQKAAFGLPVGVYDDESVNFLEREGANYNRRASPLFITLIRQNHSIYWMVTKLEGAFMDAKDKIVFNSTNRKARCRTNHEWDEENQALLRQFTNKLNQIANKVY